jgi:hypothetical protein
MPEPSPIAGGGRGITGRSGAWAVIVIAAALVWGVILVKKPIVVPNGFSAGYLSAEAELRLDPNEATAGELAAIVGLGQKRAQKIVDYRSQYQAAHPGQTAFAVLADLEGAKGIGPETAQIAGPYLVFPNAGGGADVVVSKRRKRS